MKYFELVTTAGDIAVIDMHAIQMIHLTPKVNVTIFLKGREAPAAIKLGADDAKDQEFCANLLNAWKNRDAKAPGEL